MREAFICDGIRTPIGRYGGHYQVFGLTIWLLSFAGTAGAKPASRCGMYR